MISKFYKFTLALCFFLVSANASPHTNHKKSRASLSLVSLTPSGDGSYKVKIRLTQNGKPLTEADLKEVHTQKVHLLIIDETLTDYSHAHPIPTDKPGEYEFSWTPHEKTAYRMWADITPVFAHQEYAMADLKPGEGPTPPLQKKEELDTTLEGLSFNLSFKPETIQAHKHATGTLIVKTKEGDPFKELEPLMGEYSHIVGFYDDFKTVIHIHPMGPGPSSPEARGGPDLKFHVHATQPGFVRLFTQVRVAGKDLYPGFGVTIKE